jgi:histidine triad (HIT) family protein
VATETIFDKILAKTIPAKIVHETEYALAFRDIHPQAKVHVLVIPKVKARNICELTKLKPEAQLGFFRAIQETAEVLGLTDSGFRVVFNTGVEGGQTVDYVHAHILGGEQLGGMA